MVKLVVVCVPANTHTFFMLKNRADREIHSIDYVLLQFSLCLIAHLYLTDVAMKVLALRLFPFLLAIYQLNQELHLQWSFSVASFPPFRKG